MRRKTLSGLMLAACIVIVLTASCANPIGKLMIIENDYSSAIDYVSFEQYGSVARDGGHNLLEPDETIEPGESRQFYGLPYTIHNRISIDCVDDEGDALNFTYDFIFAGKEEPVTFTFTSSAEIECSGSNAQEIETD
jgi:hypothetical protein